MGGTQPSLRPTINALEFFALRLSVTHQLISPHAVIWFSRPLHSITEKVKKKKKRPGDHWTFSEKERPGFAIPDSMEQKAHSVLFSPKPGKQA